MSGKNKSLTTEVKNETIVILSSRMAGWLMFNRFHLVDIKDDLKDKNRKIYLFKETPEIRNCMDKYSTYKNTVQ